MCGEHERDTSFMNEMVGSSPHVRGAHHLHSPNIRDFGIIPACAGSTMSTANGAAMRWDHPRMCGEHLESLNLMSLIQGSSPHVRGAHMRNQRDWPIRGIIPACAGSTIETPLEWMTQRDHPRMCGEHYAISKNRRADTGSSPHVRGARRFRTHCGMDVGIIPACAGSTSFWRRCQFGERDHPRMCGEH